jgi:hypothetical protein
MTAQRSLTPAEAFSLARRVVGRMTEAEYRTANLCPECRGAGVIEGCIIYPGSYYEPAEHEERICWICDGSGELTEPADEPTVLDLSGLDGWYSVQERSDPFLTNEGE